MSQYILKDAKSKRKFRDWLRAGLVKYGKESKWMENDEDALCALLFSCLSGRLSTDVGDISINSYKIRGRGPGAKEKKIGADNLVVLRIGTNQSTLKGFYLLQAKKAKRKNERLTGVQSQCSKMLSFTSASQVAVLLPESVKTVGAMAIAATTRTPSLSDVPFSNFVRLLVEQNMRGLMIAPLDSEYFATSELYSEIERVMTIVATEEERHREVVARIENDFREVGLGLEKFDSMNPGK